MTTDKTQTEKILWMLQAAWPGWVPATAISKISLQYTSKIFLLRKSGFLIANRITTVGRSKHSEYRLGSMPIPSSAELRKRDEVPIDTSPLINGSLFDLQTRHLDEG
jgi:hypothetical protein